ncbi:MAG TPA: outer membrane beta-barrel protein [Bacteroidales bacterium]|nr:outer membrane beta-barrel protein [Bacteroidales bacterium]HQI70905.1 outer membrane beta-barrel protein [Bacteroidales bacterium]
MKRTAFWVLLLFTLSPAGFSQHFYAGAKAGLNVIPLENHDLKGRLFSAGYHVGGMGSYKVNDWFSVSAEVMLTSQKKTYEKFDTASFIGTLAENPLLSLAGVDIDEIMDTLGMVTEYINDNVYNTRTGVVNLTYIKVPLLACFNYKSVYLSVGPYVSFLISNKTDEEFRQHIPIVETMTGLDTIPFYTSIINASFPGYSEPLVSKMEKDKTIGKIDFGLTAEVSYRLGNNVTLGVSYHQGLLNYRNPAIYKKDYLTSFNFSIGYLFGFSGNNKSIF